MHLVSPYVDIGIFTNNIDPMLAFWQEEVGLQPGATMALGPGWIQHRFDMNGSVLKINHIEAPLPVLPEGYRELFIARDMPAHRRMADPDGNIVTLVPFAERWCPGIALRLAVRDESAFHAYFGTALDLEEAGSHAYRCGNAILLFEAEEDVATAGPLLARGFRYLTVRVADADQDYAAIVGRGGQPGEPPASAGNVRYCFVQDPDGNRLELFSEPR